MQHITSIILFIFFTVSLPAQTARQFEKSADKAAAIEDWGAALEYYGKALTLQKDKPALWYKYADVAHAFHAYDIAETHYKKILIESKQKDFPLLYFRLAQVYKSQGKYEKAANTFDTYRKNAGSTKPYTDIAKEEIAICNWATETIARSDTLLEIERLDKTVNSIYSDFAPLAIGDSLFFSSYRYVMKKDQSTPKRKQTKVLMARGKSKGRPLLRGFNHASRHTAHLTFNNNKDRQYFTFCDFANTVKIRCEIYYREKKTRTRWSKPEKLPESINVKNYTATHPHIAIFNGREVLFFVSDMPGGKGGLDIWMTEMTPDGTFGKPQNLEAVNTSEDDVTPFFEPTSSTLYFSSKGHRNLGGFDVFSTQHTATGWIAVQHEGYPLNSSYDDLYYIIGEDTLTGHLASNRPGSFYINENNKACCYDIYRWKRTLPVPDTPAADTTPIVVEVPPLDTPTVEKPPEILEDFLPLALYFHNDEPDKRSRKRTTQKTYSETYNQYYTLKETYITEFTRPLSGIEKEVAISDIHTFFENKVRKNHDYLILFSDKLLRRLQDGETVEIFVKGYTSPRAKSDYNLWLSKRRISSIRNHFDRHNNGVFRPYLQSRQLIISERPFGETQASTAVSDQLEDRRNSVYSVGAAMERRVEIVEIR